MKKTNIFKKMAMVATLFAALAIGFTACSDDDDDDDDVTPQPTGNEVISDNITSDATWTSDKTYQLSGRIAVTDGATLTIEPGTVIKGESGTGANSSALVIARGSKIMAEGTADAPIIFTSLSDEITTDDIKAGNFASPNLDADVNGHWGGLIVLGKAPISVDGDEAQIEGIPASDPNGAYGGDKADDNSGVLKYISIRHGGTLIGSGNEINGLTLGGVGSGTIIENIEVVANLDDGIEWFGGTVNVKNVVVWAVGDDGIDTDQAWKGTLDNFVVITPAGHCFELDGPEGSATGGHTIKNGTVVCYYQGEAGGIEIERECKNLINTDDNSDVDLKNITFLKVKDSEDMIINRLVADEGEISFENIKVNLVDGTTLLDHLPEGTEEVPAWLSTGNAGQANEGVFGWTWAKNAGAF